MKKTQRFTVLPWLRGLDANTDEGIMHLLKKQDWLVDATDIVYDVDGSKVKREGFAFHDSAAITNTPVVVGGRDYWANLSGTKTQKIVVADNQATSKVWFNSPSGGAWTELAKDATATAAPTSVKQVSFEVFNDDLIMAFDCANNIKPVKWNKQEGGNTYKPLLGSTQAFKFIRKHQGRIWACGDPTFKDRLYFSGPGNHEEWGGDGDSGALDVDPGDGDPTGLNAIFPSFRSMTYSGYTAVLFAAKLQQIYKITGTTPVDYKITPFSRGVGVVSHNSCISVDMDDIYFCSERGFHSLVQTEKMGDFEGSYLSYDIQKYFQRLDKSQLKYIQGVWIPQLNSAAWCVSENGTNMDTILLYDVRFKAWYRWTGTTPSALFHVQDNTVNFKRMYIGTSVGRLAKAQAPAVYHDFASTAITQTVKTPFIYPDNNPATIKGMKKLGVWCKMAAGTNLTITVRLAGVNSPQTLTFASVTSGTPKLGVDFIMGVSVLDADQLLRMTPYTLPFDGYASSVQLTFTQGDADLKCALFGFWIEWEPAGDSQETIGF
jgi:hypothetical protein